MKSNLIRVLILMLLSAFSTMALAESAASPYEKALTDELTNSKKVSIDEDDSSAESQSSMRATDKLFYDICVREMVAGMKEGASDSKHKGGGIANDPEMMRSMETMAKDICACAAPKYRKVVMSSMKQNGFDSDSKQTQEYFEKEAMKAIMECM